MAALLVTWLYGVSNSFYRATELTRSRHMDLERLGAAVNHLDEAILMATFLGAVSGDTKWLSQHNGLTEQRDDAFEKMCDVFCSDLATEKAAKASRAAKKAYFPGSLISVHGSVVTSRPDYDPLAPPLDVFRCDDVVPQTHRGKHASRAA